eukprot:TRINITY_DN16739_c0_g1_i1.p1 TRINITY_DN16739_c0_g1~~TRINITY_DN16739_c0_g1_i1.p1  ORF type:complete len:362 (-),score=40.36 TRINITY_DN16739_c0_g1_i1:166-1251(-)
MEKDDVRRRYLDVRPPNIQAARDGPIVDEKIAKFRFTTIWLLVGVLVLLVFLILVASAYRAYERHAQIVDSVRLAQASGVLLTDAPRLVAEDCLPILIPLANRPEYFSQVVKALNEAPNLDDALVIFSQDGHDHTIYDLAINQLKRPEKKIHLWHRRPYFGIPSIKDNEYATSDNVYSLLYYAFEILKAPGAIILESDVVPAQDFYRYFQWVHKNILRNPQYKDRIFTVNGFNMTSRKGGDWMTLHPAGFTVWGWTMVDTMWPTVRDGFTKFHNWDHRMEALRKEIGRVSLTPEIARTKHIGYQGINFNLKEGDESWAAVYISTDPQDQLPYDEATPNIPELDPPGRVKPIQKMIAYKPAK